MYMHDLHYTVLLCTVHPHVCVHFICHFLYFFGSFNSRKMVLLGRLHVLSCLLFCCYIQRGLLQLQIRHPHFPVRSHVLRLTWNGKLIVFIIINYIPHVQSSFLCMSSFVQYCTYTVAYLQVLLLFYSLSIPLKVYMYFDLLLLF